MTLLSPPAFLETNPAVLAEAMVASFESATGRALYPAQVERLLIDLQAYREALVRQAIQGAAEQSLVAFASGPFLEALGLLVGVTERLPATQATATWRITLPGTLGVDKVFPSGWVAMAADGSEWRTTATCTVPAGQLTVTVAAEAALAGQAGNGIPIGAAFSPLENVATVASTTLSTGGAEVESDDQLRQRVMEAPFGFSVAGSSRAYRFHALSAHPSLIDVAVANAAPGVVGVYPLTRTGLPDAGVIAAVSAALSQETVRPLCDQVNVAAPARIPYVLEANLTLYSTADALAVMAAAQAAAEAFVADRAAGLGRDLIASQAIRALAVEGVYKVELVSWVDRVLGPSDWADGTPLLHNAGTANG